ncbi:MAG: phosphopantetheine adenylyltransferase [Candidatus Odinarchaeota archaeon]
MSDSSVEQQKYRVVAVGGTFDHFHKGHKHLLTKAFSLGGKVIIGVTSDEFCKNKPWSEGLQTYQVREKTVLKFIKTSFKKADFEVIMLNDKYGPAVSENNIDALVVTEQTLKTAMEINQIRINKGLKPLEIVIVDMILAYDKTPISSTRIRRGEINVDGEPVN